MGKKSEFKSIEDIIKNLKENADKLASGKLPVEEMDTLLEDSRELYERLVVLRHKAYETMVHGEVKKEEKEEVPVETVTEEEPKVSNEEAPAFNMNVFKIDDKKEKKKPKKENIQTAIEVEEASPQTSLLNPKHVNPEKPLKEETEAIVEEDVDQINLLDEIEEQQSINETHAEKGKDNTIGEKLQQTPIADLKKAIAIHKKYLFINDLFEGDNQPYNEAIDKLNSFGTLDEASNYLNSLKSERKWDEENKSVAVFQSLVERRYMVG